MAAYSLDRVKELRERTGAGMMDCKTALAASEGDIEKAIDVLRKKGVAQAAKRAGRQAKEGVIAARIRGSRAALIEANCETDFVARTDDFKKLAELALEETLAEGGAAVHSEKLAQRIAELSGKIGEKILIRRVQLVRADQGILFSYIHSNNKLGVVVEVAVSKPALGKEPLFEELGKNVALQVAASNALWLTRVEVPPTALEREKAVYCEEIKGKPPAIVEKIIQGKLDKFYKSVCLLEQPYIKEDKLSVQELLDQVGKKIGDTIRIRQFVRFQLGEAPA